MRGGPHAPVVPDRLHAPAFEADLPPAQPQMRWLQTRGLRKEGPSPEQIRHSRIFAFDLLLGKRGVGEAFGDPLAQAAAPGVELRQQGKDLVGACPFHDDDSPSLVVTPAKNLWHCLGACGRGGGPIDWVMTAQGVSFRHAVELLREGKAMREVARACGFSELSPFYRAFRRWYGMPPEVYRARLNAV